MNRDSGARCRRGCSARTARQNLGLGLREHPNAFVLFGLLDGRVVGTALLEDLERRARDRGCTKMTLEVHGTNESAKRLYARFGFEGWTPPTLFVAKPL
jgi:GNAT superfamily N-acetyltransferase